MTYVAEIHVVTSALSAVEVLAVLNLANTAVEINAVLMQVNTAVAESAVRRVRVVWRMAQRVKVFRMEGQLIILRIGRLHTCRRQAQAAFMREQQRQKRRH
jgi:CRISPR/Cas system-associated endonuclease Cas3-HD